MHDKFSPRIDASLKRLAARITRSKKRLDAAQVNRQIGRILQQNQRAAARFAIALQPDSCPAGFRLTVTDNDAFDDWAAISEGSLSPAIEYRRLERSAALEGLHPAHPGRSRFPHPEGPAERPSDLASARGPRPGSHPRLLSRLRPVEVPRDVAEPRRSRKLSAHDPRRARTHSVARRRSADRYPWPNPPALRHSARRRSNRAARPPRHRPAQAHASGRTRAANPRTLRLITSREM